MTIVRTGLSQALTSSKPIVTAECLAPRSGDAAAVKKLAAELPKSLDAVVVADSPGEMQGSALACAAILAGEGREAVLSMVTRDRNRIALESDALGAASLGVGAVLCLSGSHPALGACPQAAGVHDIDSIQLTQGLKALTGQGRGFGDGTIDPRPKLLLGAVAHPYQRPLELNLLRLKKKIAAGADFLLTQAVFDVPGFTEWMNAVRAAGLEKKVAIIASVLPLTSLEKAKVLAERQIYGPVGEAALARLGKASDPVKEGVAMASEAAVQLKAIPGVRGIHILSGGCESLAAKVIEQAALA
jgi:methylenetetrahydrofolate reductase (NADPH)